MKRINIYKNICFLLMLTLISGSCGEKIEYDNCLETMWLNPVEYEIKFAVHIAETNPLLPGGTPGSLRAEDFEKMKVSGSIEKVECDDSTTGPVNMGNTYLDRNIDFPALLDEQGSYWIGHVVYVYEYDNDKDHLNVTLSVTITMADGQLYRCNVPEKIHSEGIKRVPGELYYYVLIDIYTAAWEKV